MEILHHTNKVFVGMLEYLHKTLLVCWSISIKLWWYVGVFPLNFGGMLEYFHWKYSNIPTQFNGNTPTYHQRLMEILHHTTKIYCKYSIIPPKFNVKLWWFGGVFQLNFVGMLEYFH
jgi:hypothetical protein